LSGFKIFITENGDCENAEELFALIENIAASVERMESTPSFAASLGLQHGVSGYIFHTVSVCLHAWLSHQDDARKAILEAVRCGGDADSTAAIVGGIVGAHVGIDEIPYDWLDKMIEWPRTVAWMKKCAHEAALGQHLKTPVWFGAATFIRNLFLLLVVLGHGLRRLLPPY